MSFKRISNVALIGFSGGIMFLAALMAARALPAQDLAQYWAAAHLIRQNPYSEPLVTGFERSFGYSMQGPAMVMRNPPSALVFVLLFRYMSYNIAFAVWALLSVFIIAGCARASFSLRGTPESSLAPAFLCLLFGPTVALLMLGQIAVLLLLGITVFLIATERKHDWLAGASLSLMCVKPHVVLLFLIVVTLWSLRTRRWAILVSAGLSLATSGAIALLLNPHILPQYLAFARQFAGETTPYPNIGGMLYVVFGRRELAFLPQLAGLIWMVFYWRNHRSNWDWKSHGMIVVLVSVVSSYYSFPFDQIVMLPALMIAFANGNRRIFMGAFLATNLGFALYIFNVAGRFGFGYMFLWWTAAAWLITYVFAQRAPGRQPAQSGEG
jgi:hypothetical protein